MSPLTPFRSTAASRFTQPGAFCFLALLWFFGGFTSHLHAGVVISEFLAENDGLVRDRDGDSPDWIEIHNDTSQAVNLDGWHLTDSPTNLTRWTFPATNIPPDGYLLVFASGKNRVQGELHTNFQLDNEGEFLALVMPGGTLAHAYSAFPPQRANRSFGMKSQTISSSLILSGATARVTVPIDGSLGSAWTEAGFNDEAWTSAATPVGYDTSGGSSNVLSLDFDERNAAPQTMQGFRSYVINSNPTALAVQTLPTTRQFDSLSVTLSHAGAFGYDDRIRSGPLNSGAFTRYPLLRDFVFSTARTNNDGFDVTFSGLQPERSYYVTLWSYDASSPGTRVADWYANGFLAVDNYTFDGRQPPMSNDDYRFTFPARSDAAGQLVIGGRRDSASLNGPTPDFGVFLNALSLDQLGYASFVATDLETAMRGRNSSLFVRLRFQVSHPADIDRLRLRLRYDDGFAAYLNGQLVGARNAPSSPGWNSAATTARSPLEGLTAEEITVFNAPGLLLPGENVLALQGLNVDVNDSDFLLLAELTGDDVVTHENLYFANPTPGAPNAAGFSGFVADTKFSVDRGFYDAPFTVAITSVTPGAEIRWTRNASVPSLTNGFVYAGPIAITNTTLLRAAAFAPGLIPTEVDTHTYIFLDQVLRQSGVQPGHPTLWQANYPGDYGMDSNVVDHPDYAGSIKSDLRAIPTLSIVADHSAFWDPATGIYVDATRRLERAASAELFNGDNTSEFQINCAVEMHGNASRDNVRTPKHSMRLSFKSEYGPTRLHHDWFGGGVEEHNSIVLRSCGFVDGWAGRYADNGLYTSSETGETFRGLRYRPENTCYVRDVWVKESFRAMGWSASRSAYVHLYINGLYWGLYQPSERLTASYFALRHGGEEQAWDVIVGEDNNGPPVLVDGSLADWQEVLNIVNAGITNETAYQAVAERVDIDNLIDYMLLHIFAESEDWPRHNWYVAHRRATNGVPGTKFICSVWDQELTLDRLVRRNRVEVGNAAGEIYSPARVYAQLRSRPEFRVRFGDRIHKHLANGGALTPSNNVSRLLAEAIRIREAVVGESARWGDARETPVPPSPPQVGTGKTFTRDEWWQPEIDKLATNFFQTLTATNLARLRAGGLYPSIAAPEFSQFGGGVPAGFQLEITQTNASGTIFYTTDGADPRVYGSGAVAPGAQTYTAPVPINAPTVVRARVLSGSLWSALVEATFFPPQDLSKLVLSEIMYHAPNSGVTNGEEFEFLELKNTGSNAIDLTGLVFTDGISAGFTNGTILQPGAFWLMARNPAAFAAKYGMEVNGFYIGRLSNEGERLTLSHPLGQTVFSVEFGDAAPWPATADGYGFSLVQKEPITSQAPDNPSRWRASTWPGGSPGTDDPWPSLPPVVINEVLAASTAPDVDQIELHNPSAATVDVGGWFLTDEKSYPWKFRIPNGASIGPGEFLVVEETQFGGPMAGSNAFALSSRGDQLYLFSADAHTNLTGYSHGVDFGASLPGISFGRYLNSVGEEQFPAQVARSFSATNVGPRFGPVVINEIHYHPPPGGDEFIELKNNSGSSVALFNATGGWRLNGAGFMFPTNAAIGGHGYLLIVATNTDAFRAKYMVPESVPIFGPFSGVLQDSGERLRLEHPAAIGTNEPAYVTVEEIRYNDRAPWSAAADGAGPSLQRKEASEYGNDPSNWDSALPTPGQPNLTRDRDHDGLPDAWEEAYGTDPDSRDGAADPDGDGRSNLEEYVAGTLPNDALSRFTIVIDAAAQVTFQSVVGRLYTLEHSDSLPPTWTEALAPVNGNGSPMTLHPTATASGFYRLRVERQ